MKILVLLNTLQSAGGVETSLLHKAMAWVCAGYEVEVSTLDGDATDFLAFPSEVRRVSLGVSYEARERLHSYGNLCVALRHAWALRSRIRKAKPDVVVNCIYGYSFYFLPLLAPAGVKLVSENHSSRFVAADASSFIARAKGRLRRWFESRYSRVIFLSKEEAAISGLANVVVIPNGLPPLPEGWDLPPKKPIVIAAGRICHVKGFDRLLDAWRLAAPRMPDWQLHIYGDGEPSDVLELKTRISTHGLGRSVRLHPATTEISDRIAESALYAMASRSECFPMVLLEAMQRGVPVVAYDCPTGPRNIVLGDTTGRLVPDGDALRFADALVELASDSETRRVMSVAAQAEAHRYELPQVMPLWDSLFGKMK